MSIVRTREKRQQHPKWRAVQKITLSTKLKWMNYALYLIFFLQWNSGQLDSDGGSFGTKPLSSWPFSFCIRGKWPDFSIRPHNSRHVIPRTHPPWKPSLLLHCHPRLLVQISQVLCGKTIDCSVLSNSHLQTHTYKLTPTKPHLSKPTSETSC